MVEDQHFVGSGSWQVPVVTPTAAATQRAGDMQNGPLTESHAAPSAASATQVPVLVVLGVTHSEAPTQMVLLDGVLPEPAVGPQNCVAGASTSLTQVPAVIPGRKLQYNPFK